MQIIHSASHNTQETWSNVTSTLLFFLLIAFTLLPGTTMNTGIAMAGTEATGVDVYFFYSDTCPHCHAEMGLMQALAENNTDITIHFHEVSRDAEIWETFRNTHKITSSSIPRTVIGEMSFIGYSATADGLHYSEPFQGYQGNASQIIKAIEKELGHKVKLGESFIRPVGADRILPLGWPLVLPLLYCISYFIFRKKLADPQRRRLWLGGLAAIAIIAGFMLLSTVSETEIQTFAERLPYPLFVVTIALADGFNPCAFTVLIILLSLLTHTKGRRDMALIGFTFIATSAVMYFLFIMLMVIAGSYFIEQYGRTIMIILGVIVAIAGCINIKDYFFLHQGFSLGLSAKQQKEFGRKASAIVRDLKKGSGKLHLAVGATIFLAVFVNIIELGCTAMLPMVYMTTLVNRFDSYAGYSFWTAVYAVVYIAPLLLILINFIYFFTSIRISETTGRLLKLAAGSFMLFFGLIMIFRPNLLLFG